MTLSLKGARTLRWRTVSGDLLTHAKGDSDRRHSPFRLTLLRRPFVALALILHSEKVLEFSSVASRVLLVRRQK